MSDYEKEDRADAAREFLATFLVQLQGLKQAIQDQTKIQVQTNQQHLQGAQLQQKVLLEVSALNARLDGLAQRCDFLYEQMGRLGEILLEDSAAAVDGQPLPPMIGQAFQGVVQSAVDGLVYGANGRRGNSGRRRGR